MRERCDYESRSIWVFGTIFFTVTPRSVKSGPVGAVRYIKIRLAPALLDDNTAGALLTLIDRSNLYSMSKVDTDMIGISAKCRRNAVIFVVECNT